MAPVRISFVVTELDPGGAERALWQLVRRLDRGVFEPLVICLGPEAKLCPEFRDAGIEVRCLAMNGLVSVPGVLWRLIGELRRFKPQLIQTWLFHANLLGRVASVFCPRAKVVSGIRVAEKRANGYLWLERLTEPLATTHICVSQSVAEFSIREGGLKPAKCVVIPNGVELPDQQQIEPLPQELRDLSEGEPLGLMVGRLDPQKGIDRLIQVAAHLKQEFPSLKWAICGAGQLRSELQELAGQFGVSDRLLWLGFQSQLSPIYRRADFLLFPSRWEGMPNVVLEAMAHGLPVISTNVEGVDELLTVPHPEQEFTQPRGIVVSGESEQQLVANLSTEVRRILTDSELSDQMRDVSQRFVSQCFTWDFVAENYASFYQKLMSAR